jgi:hypothetical protein
MTLEIGDCFWYKHESFRGVIQEDLMQVIDKKENKGVEQYKIKILYVSVDEVIWKWKDGWLTFDEIFYPIRKTTWKEAVTYVL